MKSSLDILSALFSIVNPVVKNTMSSACIDGKVYINGIPNGNQKENVNINTLYNPNEYLQTGYANVNIHLKEISSGRPNLKRFQEIVNSLIPILKDCKHNNIYFQIDEDKGIMKDNNNDGMYFYNIRLEFQT